MQYGDINRYWDTINLYRMMEIDAIQRLLLQAYGRFEDLFCSPAQIVVVVIVAEILWSLLKRKFSGVVNVSVDVGIGGSKNKETGQLDVNCLLAVQVQEQALNLFF